MQVHVTSGGPFEGITYQVGIQSVDDRIATRMLSAGFANQVRDIFATMEGGQIGLLVPDVGSESLKVEVVKGSNIAAWMPAGTGRASFSNFSTIFGQNVPQPPVGEQRYGTMHMAVELMGHFTEVAIIIGNCHPAHNVELVAAAAVVAPNFDDLKMDAAFATAPEFTFNGMRGAIAPVRNNAVVGAVGQQLIVSDFLPIESLQRTDVIDGLPILMVRALFNGYNGKQMSYWIRSGAEWGPAGNARKLYTARPMGDFLHAPLAGDLSTPVLGEALNFCTIMGVIYKTKNKSITVMFDGDSTNASDYVGQADRAFGWVDRGVKQVSTLKRPVECVNAAQPAQTSTNYSLYANHVLDNIPVTHIVHLGFSINDATQAGGASAGFQAQLNTLNANAALVKAKAESKGVKFCISTGMPRNSDGVTSYWDGTLGAMAEQFKSSLRNIDLPVIDPQKVVTNKTAVPWRWQTVAAGDAADFTTDFQHPNLACRQGVLLSECVSFITKLRDLSLPV